jgi:hypothetical protein
MTRTGSHPPVIKRMLLSSILKLTSSPRFPAQWTPRLATVKPLYERLMEVRLIQVQSTLSLFSSFNHFFQVRGTPGSGKTTLRDLLHAYILLRHPNAVVEVITSWPKESGTSLRERMHQRISTYPFVEPDNHYLLFDNAHGTYWDGVFWEDFLKDIVQRGLGPRVILFCGHGSPLSQPVDYDNGTPLRLLDCSRVSLRRYNCCNLHHSPLGLLFSQEEFGEAVERFNDPDHNAIRLDEELREILF